MNLPLPRASIAAVGARACNGITALQVAMSVRADKFVPRASHLVDRAGDFIATARLASIGDDRTGLERLVQLGGPALTQAAGPLRARFGDESPPIPLFCALPEKGRPGADPRVAADLTTRLEARSRVRLDHERSRLFFEGRGGGALALAAALEAIRGGLDPVMVGAVDSYFHPDTLEWLDRELRLHSMTAENGFIPGEGGAFLLLGTSLGLAGMPRMAHVLDVASAAEPSPYGSEQPCLARGITQAARAVLSSLGTASQVGWILTDVVDERHRVDEWAFAAARIAPALRPAYRHEQPLLLLGDLGAATVPMMLALAAVRWQTGSAPDDLALLAAHSEGPLRTAVLAAAAPPP